MLMPHAAGASDGTDADDDWLMVMMMLKIVMMVALTVCRHRYRYDHIHRRHYTKTAARVPNETSIPF